MTEVPWKILSWVNFDAPVKNQLRVSEESAIVVESSACTRNAFQFQCCSSVLSVQYFASNLAPSTQSPGMRLGHFGRSRAAPRNEGGHRPSALISLLFLQPYFTYALQDNSLLNNFSLQSKWQKITMTSLNRLLLPEPAWRILEHTI